MLPLLNCPETVGFNFKKFVMYQIHNSREELVCKQKTKQNCTPLKVEVERDSVVHRGPVVEVDGSVEERRDEEGQ